MVRAMGSLAAQPPLVRAMLEPGFYPGAPRVELRETHTSWVFLAGDRAYKVKKPVVFPFLDYGTLDRRREMCERELRLNRRLAPEIYLAVVGVTESEHRYSLTDPDDPAAVEYAVEMRRVDESRSLEVLVTNRELEPAHVLAVGRLLARFHAEAPIAPPALRGIEILVATLKENLTTLREAGETVLGRHRLDATERFTHAFFSAHRGELVERGRSGLIRDGHGDLRAEHVIVPAEDAIYIYDCIEFDPALRQIDVAADLAFLLMDLARLGAEHPAFELVDAYRSAGGEPGDDALLSFFAAYRAWVRAKIASLQAHEHAVGDPERDGLEARAGTLMRLGHRFAWRARGPLVLVICGVAATGKSTLAREVAAASGWEHVSSDLTRKRLAGIDPRQRAGEGHYSPEFTLRTYAELGKVARAELDRNAGVIVDATFHRRVERDAFRAELGDRRTLFVECRAPFELLRERIRTRELDPDRVSDADAEVVRRQLAEFEPLAEVAAGERTGIATEAAPAELLTRVESFVDDRVWNPGG
jgi:aminoglycoside phosphotransferase family enzyme